MTSPDDCDPEDEYPTEEITLLPVPGPMPVAPPAAPRATSGGTLAALLALALAVTAGVFAAGMVLPGREPAPLPVVQVAPAPPPAPPPAVVPVVVPMPVAPPRPEAESPALAALLSRMEEMEARMRRKAEAGVPKPAPPRKSRIDEIVDELGKERAGPPAPNPPRAEAPKPAPARPAVGAGGAKVLPYREALAEALRSDRPLIVWVAEAQCPG